MKSFTLAVLAASFVLAGCATQETLVPTGGNRAGGTVNLSYEYGLFQKPVVNMNQAAQSAAHTCAAWGYSGAQPFGGQINHCEEFNGYGNCLRMRVTVRYQCTGNPNSSK